MSDLQRAEQQVRIYAKAVTHLKAQLCDAKTSEISRLRRQLGNAEIHLSDWEDKVEMLRQSLRWQME